MELYTQSCALIIIGCGKMDSKIKHREKDLVYLSKGVNMFGRWKYLLKMQSEQNGYKLSSVNR